MGLRITAIVFSFLLFCGLTHNEFSIGKRINGPFDTLTYDKVVAYDFSGEHEMQIVVEGRLNKDIITREQVLTSKQVKSICKLIQNNDTYGNNTADCFEPHLGLVWYNKNEIAAYVSICLACNYLTSSMEIPATSHKKLEFIEGQDVPLKGFSKTGRKKINSFIKELGFSHVSNLQSVWDKE